MGGGEPAKPENKSMGYLGAIAMYMDNIGIPKFGLVHKRVKLFVVMYKQLQLENERLKILVENLDFKESDKI